MSKVELEPPPAEIGVQLRFAERVIDEADLARIGVQVSSQQLAQRPARDHETPLIALETKPRGAIALVIREHRVIPLGGDVQANAPTLHGVHHPPSRTPSARATTISRGPSNGSLPCAVRMLSTTSTSPACHGSRTVWAS